MGEWVNDASEPGQGLVEITENLREASVDDRARIRDTGWRIAALYEERSKANLHF
jgi:hypothetical protein